jgi:fructose-bisphosphate aldolase, class II
MTLKETLAKASAERRAVGHFNISELGGFKAIIAAAKELGVPVMIGTSEGEREFIDPRLAVQMVRIAREELGLPIYLNADHTHSFEKAKEAVDAGYDEVLFDGGKLPLAENIRITKQVVEYAKSKNPDILVEGELGYIGSGSVILDEIPAGAALRPEDLTKPEEALQFIRETGVDMLAPAVGNFHGLLAHGQKPRLDIGRIKAIKDAVLIPMVLHGGSGSLDEDFTAAIDAGMTVIHVNTELRKAWRDGMVEALQAMPNEVTPYKLLGPSILDVQRVVKARLSLFNRIK